MSLQHMWLLCYGCRCADGAAGFVQTLLFATVFYHRCFPHTVFHWHHYPNNQIYPLLPYTITSVHTPSLIALPFHCAYQLVRLFTWPSLKLYPGQTQNWLWVSDATSHVSSDVSCSSYFEYYQVFCHRDSLFIHDQAVAKSSNFVL